MNKLTFALLLSGLAAAAQTKPSEPGNRPITYEFKNADVPAAREIVLFVTQLNGPGVMVHLNESFKTAIVYANRAANPSPDAVEKALEMLKRYDVAATPAPRIQFVGYLVWASENYGSPPGQPIPAAIQEAIVEMKKTFTFTDYKLLDTVSTEVRRHTEVENILTVAGTAYSYTIVYDNPGISNDGKTVSVNPFKFSLRVPSGGTYLSTGITTDVAIREGEKLVIGKVRIGLNDSVNIFLVLTVKVVR